MSMPMKSEKNGYMIVNNECDPSNMEDWILIYKNNDKQYFSVSFEFHPLPDVTIQRHALAARDS